MSGIKSSKGVKLKESRGRPRGETRAGTLKDAAYKLGLPVDLLRMARAMGCTAFLENGGVNLPELSQWFVENKGRLPDATGMVSKIQEDALDKKAIREMREHKLALARREVIPATEMRLTFTRAVLDMRRRLIAGVRTLGQEIALHCGGTEEQIAWALNLSERRARDILTDFSANEWCDER